MKQMRAGRTATVYSLDERRRAMLEKPQKKQEFQRVEGSPAPVATFGVGWSHDAAIRDDAPGLIPRNPS